MIGTTTTEPTTISAPAMRAQRPLPRYVSTAMSAAPTAAIANAATGMMPVSVYCAFCWERNVNSPARRTLTAAPYPNRVFPRRYIVPRPSQAAT